MISVRRFLVISTALATLIPATGIAQQLAAFKTPPAELNRLTQLQLNQFGEKAINEAYTIFSEVGSKTGEIGGTLNQENKNAVRNAKALIDDKALIQSARLTYGLTKGTFTPSDIDNFSVSDVVVTRPGSDVLVASYKISLPNRVDLKTKTMMSGKSMPRLTVLRWDEKKKQWLVFSHADFDTPAAMLCNASSGKKPQKSHFNPADIKLARKLLDEQIKGVMAGNTSDSRGQGYQSIFASGELQSSLGPVRYTLSEKPKISHFEATRHGDLLALRFDGPGAASVDGGAVERATKPRLMTYYQEPDGSWKRIAAAIFSVTTKVADTIKCVEPTVK